MLRRSGAGALLLLVERCTAHGRPSGHRPCPSHAGGVARLGVSEPLLCMESSTPPGDTAWAMSEENVEAFKRGDAAWNRGDIDAALEVDDPEVEVHAVAPAMLLATLPPVIAGLAEDLLRNPAVVQIGQRAATAVGITQAAYPVPDHLKTALLRHLLRHTEMPSVLVSRGPSTARQLARAVAADGFKVAELHSNLTQPQRAKAMEGFRRGTTRCWWRRTSPPAGWTWTTSRTSSAWTCRTCPTDYVHRIGRTARAGSGGRRLRPGVAGRGESRWRGSSGRSASGCRESRCRTSTTDRRPRSGRRRGRPRRRERAGLRDHRIRPEGRG